VGRKWRAKKSTGARGGSKIVFPEGGKSTVAGGEELLVEMILGNSYNGGHRNKD
jgi:hypothetical protein